MPAGGFSISARRRWRFPVLTMGALVLVATTLVALPRASAPAAASPQDGSWQLGLICSCTGPEASSTSTSAPALEAWPDAVNAKGGIDGHKVNLIVKDDDTNPTTALHEAEQLVSQDHVLAIFDNSDVDTAFATYVAQHHVPVVGSYAVEQRDVVLLRLPVDGRPVGKEVGIGAARTCRWRRSSPSLPGYCRRRRGCRAGRRGCRSSLARSASPGPRCRRRRVLFLKPMRKAQSMPVVGAFGEGERRRHPLQGVAAQIVEALDHLGRGGVVPEVRGFGGVLEQHS